MAFLRKPLQTCWLESVRGDCTIIEAPKYCVVQVIESDSGVFFWNCLKIDQSGDHSIYGTQRNSYLAHKQYIHVFTELYSHEGIEHSMYMYMYIVISII